MLTTTLKRWTGDLVFTVAILAALFYFGHRAIQGESGFFARLSVQQEERRLSEELARLSAEKAQLDNLTRRLSTGYLDLDLLDEQARDVLGYLHPDEVVIR